MTNTNFETKFTPNLYQKPGTKRFVPDFVLPNEICLRTTTFFFLHEKIVQTKKHEPDVKPEPKDNFHAGLPAK